jgi:hypothetical protein
MSSLIKEDFVNVQHTKIAFYVAAGGIILSLIVLFIIMQTRRRSSANITFFVGILFCLTFLISGILSNDGGFMMIGTVKCQI